MFKDIDNFLKFNTKIYKIYELNNNNQMVLKVFRVQI